MENTAKNFAIQLGSLISLYVVVGSLITLLFGVINIVYPDPAEYLYVSETATSSVRFAIALLVVFYPTYVLLTRITNKTRRTESGSYVGLTKWLIYLSLVVGGGILLGDLVTVLNTFLNGEITTRFILKALAFFIVVGTAFVYYLLDARNYWQLHEKRSLQYGAVTSVIVLASLAIGFMHIETPSEVRELRIDQQQIADLRNMQYSIENFYQLKKHLPSTVTELYVGDTMPVATEGRSNYSYRIIDEQTFELCAEFAMPTQKSEMQNINSPLFTEGVIINAEDWNHEAGTACFKRVIQKMSPSTDVVGEKKI